MFFSLKNGRTIDSNYPRIWPVSTACYPSSGSASFGAQIVFSKMPRKSRSKQWQYPIITFGSTKIAPFSTWSSEFPSQSFFKELLESLLYFSGLLCSSVVLCTLKITHMTSKYADYPWRAVSLAFYAFYVCFLCLAVRSNFTRVKEKWLVCAWPLN